MRSHVATKLMATRTSAIIPASVMKASLNVPKMRVASVSNSNGESSRLIGSSFIVESKTKPPAASSPGVMIGNSTEENRRFRDAPSVWAASVNPDGTARTASSVVPIASAANRTA